MLLSPEYVLIVLVNFLFNCNADFASTWKKFTLLSETHKDDLPFDPIGASSFLLSMMLKKRNSKELNLDDALAYIHPKHFALLLQFNGDLSSTNGEITNKTFLQTFSKFLVSFEVDNEKNTAFGNMDKLLRTVSEYNLRQSTANITSALNNLQLWISIPATKSITNIVFKTMTRIQRTNSVFPNTVAALLLNYRSLHVTAESVHAILSDIKLSKVLAKNMIGKEFKTGVILEVHNCRTYSESSPLSDLKLDNKDELLLISQLHGEAQEIDFTFPLYSCLTSGDFVRAKLSLEIPVKTVISLEKSTFEFIHPVGSPLETYSIFAGISNKRIILKVEINELSKRKPNEESTKNGKIDTTWLEEESIFDNVHLGSTIYSTNEPGILQSVLPHLFHNFRKIIVQSVRVNEDHNDAQLQQFVVSMARYQMSQVRAQMNRGEIKHDDIPAQLMIAANINHDDRASSFGQVKDAVEAATLANKEYPGIATTVILSLQTCSMDNQVAVNDGKEILLRSKFLTNKFPSRIMSLMQSFLVYKKELRNNYEKNEHLDKLGVGVISEFCVELIAAGVSSLLSVSLNDNTPESIFYLLKLPVHIADILEYGATRSASSVIHSSRNCEVIMLLNLKEQMQKFNLYVQLTGCSGSYNYTDIYQLAEVAKFWELLNSWAVKEDKVVFMDTAFEYPTNFAREQGTVSCSKSFNSCGWWKVKQRTSGNDSYAHNYTCENGKSIALKMYEKLYGLTTNKESNTGKGSFGVDKKKILIPVMTAVTLFVLGVVVISASLIFYYRSKYILSRNEVQSFTRGDLTSGATDSETAAVDANTVGIVSQPYNKAKYEIARSLFEFDSKRCLGSGEFATVTMGTIKRANKRIQVAVKMIKKRPVSTSSHSHYLAVKALISEIKILSYVGEHRHVIKLEGAYTAKMRSGKLLVFLEMCELGSLKKYLTANATSVVEGQGNMEMKNFTLSPEMAKDLCRWSIEIASGMEFLSSKKIVHADLATRNILLNASKCAKISDFGLSRRLYDYSEYLKKEAGPLPWRWMAPESLRRMIFNEKSDVWAFGVTLWEMYSLGDEPYPGLAWEMNFPLLLERGLRLSEPRHNQQSIYLLMKRCWELAPANRPTFAELNAMLQEHPFLT